MLVIFNFLGGTFKNKDKGKSQCILSNISQISPFQYMITIKTMGILQSFHTKFSNSSVYLHLQYISVQTSRISSAQNHIVATVLDNTGQGKQKCILISLCSLYFLPFSLYVFICKLSFSKIFQCSHTSSSISGALPFL